jgi:hypothetical protein
MSDLHYADPRLNLETGDSLSPVIENGVLASLPTRTRAFVMDPTKRNVLLVTSFAR